MGGTLLTTKKLKKVYQSDKQENTVIDNLDLTIYDREFAVIMGSSGSGKSTLLYLLGGLDQTTAGEIWFQDQAIHHKTEKQLALWRRKNLGFVFQSANLVPNLSLLENILVAGYLVSNDRSAVRQRAGELLQQAGLEELSHRLPSQLSGGQQQRGAIVRALINAPRILLADEPTGSLNSASSKAVLDIFSAFHRAGQTVLMVTHDIKSACHGQRVLYFRDGLIVDELKFGDGQKDIHDREEQLANWLVQKDW